MQYIDVPDCSGLGRLLVRGGVVVVVAPVSRTLGESGDALLSGVVVTGTQVAAAADGLSLHPDMTAP